MSIVYYILNSGSILQKFSQCIRKLIPFKKRPVSYLIMFDFGISCPQSPISNPGAQMIITFLCDFIAEIYNLELLF